MWRINTKVRLIIKAVIAILLLLCLANMPYGFYQLVRIAASAAFLYFSYDYFCSKRVSLGMLFAVLAILFQPFIKVALGRMIWNCVDVVVAFVLFYLIITNTRPPQK